MSRIPAKREIIDRKCLVAPLHEAAKSGRPAVLDLLKQILADGRATIRRRFEESRDGLGSAASTAYLVDQLISLIHEHACAVYPEPNPTAAERLALVAVGGYGRAEMAPFSDIDLLFLRPYKKTPRGEQIVEHVLYLLWDLGLTVGHATRTVNECLVRARADITIRTTLLESRFLLGDQPLYVELRRRFADEVIAATGPEFLAAKLEERDARHARMGDTRYVLEPNIKEGKGGLRDLHTLFWIAKYLYRTEAVGDLVARGVLTARELRKFNRAHRFLWTVRYFLHLLAGRPEERLTFDLQPAIAKAMRYADRSGASGIERFMKHYYLVAKDIGDLTRIFCADLEASHQRRRRFSISGFGLAKRDVDGFRVDNGRVTVVEDEDFAKNPIRMITIFAVAQSHDFDIHPHALRLITRNLARIDARLRASREANAVFMKILASRDDPETTLTRMNEAGVLGRFIPAFGRVVAQSQHDMYHVYTVDAHTLFAIGILSRIEDGLLKDELPLATEIMAGVLSRRVLYLAVFLHDIAKGRKEDHSILGARIARKIGPRLGLNAEETETTAWLVRNHLIFSDTAFKRDIADPKTVSDFVALVQSPERLRLLLVLTVADIRAVGPNVWNGWKGQLLRQLYHQAEASMLGDEKAGGRAARAAMAQDLFRAAAVGWPEEDVESFIARGYPSYWLAFDAATHLRHAEMIREADRAGAPLAVKTRADRFRAVTELSVYAANHHGLFAGIAGAIAVCGGNIVEARVFTTSDGMALDSFWIQDADGGSIERSDKLARLASTIERTLSQDFKPAELLSERKRKRRRTDVFKIEPRVLIDNRASATFSVIEINARDRIGLIFDIARALVALRLSVANARIATYGERAVDVFYVRDQFGMKVTDAARMEDIRTRILAALVLGAALDDAPAAERSTPAAAE